MSVGAVHPRRRRHSKQHRIEELLRSLGNDWQGGPTALARIAAEQLCEIVTKQEARLVLMQSKLPPQEPLPPPPEVGQFRSWVADIWRHRDQVSITFLKWHLFFFKLTHLARLYLCNETR